jgi:hypothetical protein
VGSRIDSDASLWEFISQLVPRALFIHHIDLVYVFMFSSHIINVCRVACVLYVNLMSLYLNMTLKNIYFQDGGLTATIALCHMSMSFASL